MERIFKKIWKFWTKFSNSQHGPFNFEKKMIPFVNPLYGQRPRYQNIRSVNFLAALSRKKRPFKRKFFCSFLKVPRLVTLFSAEHFPRVILTWFKRFSYVNFSANIYEWQRFAIWFLKLRSFRISNSAVFALSLSLRPFVSVLPTSTRKFGPACREIFD